MVDNRLRFFGARRRETTRVEAIDSIFPREKKHEYIKVDIASDWDDAMS